MSVRADQTARPRFSLGRALLARRRRGALAEAVLGAARQRLQVAHAARARRAATLGLLRPLVGPDLGRRVAAAGALLLLVVVGALAAAGAQPVCLLVPLAHGRGPVAAAWQPRHRVQCGAFHS